MLTNDNKTLLKEKLSCYLEQISERSKSGFYVCPLCGSGTGKKGTGALSVRERTYWKCFSCGESGDIFSLCGKVEGLAGYAEQVERLADIFGVETFRAGAGVRVGVDSSSTGIKKVAKISVEKVNVEKSNAELKTPPYATPIAAQKDEKRLKDENHSVQNGLEDLNTFFLAANGRISEISYPHERGLGKALIDRFRLGYVPNWRHPKVPHAPTSPRLIIPTGPQSYLARDIRAHIPEREKPYSKSQVGSIELFNAEALWKSDQPVFVVEGALDALSIMEVGGEAVALGTTAKVKSFVDLVSREKPCHTLLLALDNDEAGNIACKKLEDGLLQASVDFNVTHICGEYKDANEALQKNREKFVLAVNGAVNSVHSEERNPKESQKGHKEDGNESEKVAYKATSAGNCMQGFLEWVELSAQRKHISTGFEAMDRELDGGLYEGLYVMGAISSLGKTTLVTQIADQIAMQGIDILIFSLEMAKTEIMAKSVSRHTLLRAIRYDGNTRNAKTTRGITDGVRYEHYSLEESSLIYQSMDDYMDYAKHIYISEGIGDIGVKEIREAVKKHVELTGNVPVIVVDYVQILAPYSVRATDKQNTDKAVLELKRLSRDMKTPIIGISSLNRASYKDAVSMEAFKESGAIEYSSDVLLGLQLKGVGDRDFDPTDAKRKSPREVELVVLKNRNGRVGGRVEFQYYPLFNYFKEVG